jgi:hypothetical protein
MRPYVHGRGGEGTRQRHHCFSTSSFLFLSPALPPFRISSRLPFPGSWKGKVAEDKHSPPWHPLPRVLPTSHTYFIARRDFFSLTFTHAVASKLVVPRAFGDLGAVSKTLDPGGGSSPSSAVARGQMLYSDESHMAISGYSRDAAGYAWGGGSGLCV